MVMWYSILLIGIVFLVLGIDFILSFHTWQSRIHIGRFTSKEIWQEKLTAKALQWLKKSPTVKLTDQNRLVIIDMLKGNYRRSAIQHWQEASLIMGLSKRYQQTKDEKIKKSIDQWLTKNVNTDGSWKHPIQESDGVILGYVLFQIPWLDVPHYKPAFDQLWQLLLSLKGEDGTVAYKKHTMNVRFVDTLGFICPFLVEYGQRFHCSEATALAILQLEEYKKYGMMKEVFIPCHTYSMKTKLPVGLFGWGRGLAWYALGIAGAWQSLENEHPKKMELRKDLERFAQSAVKFQRTNGSWGWNVLEENSRADSSSTAVLAWMLQLLDPKKYKTEIEKAQQYLMSVTRRNGAIDFSQGDTKAIGVYAQTFDVLPLTQGFALIN